MTPRKKQIVKELEDRGADASCPMCGNSNFTFVGESEIPLSDSRKRRLRSHRDYRMSELRVYNPTRARSFGLFVS